VADDDLADLLAQGLKDPAEFLGAFLCVHRSPH
jgi:hypothetical protein